MTTAQLTPPATVGMLTPEFLVELREGYQMSTADRACHNAVSNTDTNSLALNHGVVRSDDGHFSHRIKSQGITNQKKSGRCWMFAGLNMLRPKVIRDHHMTEFEFSTVFLQFWDKLEKSNLFLESVIELRDADTLDREWEIINRSAVEDGGWWNYVAGLIEKYGVVPASAMPETHAGTHTETLNHVLGRLLRTQAVRILNAYADGADLKALQALKQKALKEVYRFLVINLGEPPTEFEWRYQVRSLSDSLGNDSAIDMKTAAEERLTPPEHHTPQTFRKKYIGDSLANYVCLYNDPHNELNRHYRFGRARNIVNNECMHFVNIDTAPLKKIAIASILANEPLWFAVNMNVDQSKERGVMEHQLFDYESLFGIDLTLSKADRIRFHAGASCHAMVLMGVDLTTDGQPRKWLVENSWGDEKGNKGLWTLHDKWFDEHVYALIVDKNHVPDEIMKHFEEETIELPAWYPGALGIQ